MNRLLGLGASIPATPSRTNTENDNRKAMILNEELLFGVWGRFAEISQTAAARPGFSPLVNLETGDWAK